ncbi:3-keto-disaccharide hydrolase [Pelagicoccus mobilis]|uniref:DUF1080 domain-containing protein n=1 Tax=Pelagicoccus mobilis TaxID=415221 RepID=A0A934RYY9_9BACT|nr:DUF1080 domain-containing protein [Pelagicoccus mobilis]MBK1877441.1 DUF1080 domain-containing protein [Pelagicoccus mobilis]
MKNIITFLTSWLLFTAAVNAEDGFKSIFNGKDLSGWEGQEGLWSVKDNAIVGSTEGVELKANTFLVWKEGEVSNFHLKLRLKIAGENNSGVMYRAQSVEGAAHALSGPQLDVHPKHEYMGMYYSEGTGRGIVARRGQKVLVTDKVNAKGKSLPEVKGKVGSDEEFDVYEWNDYEVIAVGKRMIHKVNGVVTVAVADRFPGAQTSGLIGIQLHRGPAMQAYVKDIRLKKLSGDAAKSALREAVAGN